jgi:hypothetical protein
VQHGCARLHDRQKCRTGIVAIHAAHRLSVGVAPIPTGLTVAYIARAARSRGSKSVSGMQGVYSERAPW